MDSDAWRPFDPVDVKRQVGPGRGAATTGRFRRAVVGGGWQLRRQFCFRWQWLHLARCRRGDFHHAQNWCWSMISCENWFPLLGITGSARLATSTRWTPSA